VELDPSGGGWKSKHGNPGRTSRSCFPGARDGRQFAGVHLGQRCLDVLVDTAHTVYAVGQSHVALISQTGCVASEFRYHIYGGWPRRIPYSFAGVAMGADGSIFIAASRWYPAEGFRLAAIDSRGSKLWAYDYPFTGHVGAPVVDAAGNVYATHEGRLFCLSPEGVCRWEWGKHPHRYGLPSESLSSPAMDTNGNVYVFQDYGGRSAICCFSGDGQLTFRVQVREEDYLKVGAVPVVDTALQRIYCRTARRGAGRGGVCCISMLGDVIWRAELGGDDLDPQYSDLALGQDGSVLAISDYEGKPALWRLGVDGDVLWRAQAFMGQGNLARYYSCPTVDADDNVFVGASAGCTYGLVAFDSFGAVKWGTQFGEIDRKVLDPRARMIPHQPVIVRPGVLAVSTIAGYIRLFE